MEWHRNCCFRTRAVDVRHRPGDEGYVRPVEGYPEGAGNFCDPPYAVVGETAGS